MNAELARLLEEAGVPDRITWQDLVLVQNYHAVPTPRSRVMEESLDRGFNVVVLRDGAPTHFCKCRPSGNASLDREARIRTSLGNETSDGLRIPMARCAASDLMTVQVSPFLDGSHFGRIAPKQSRSDFLDTMAKLVDGAGVLADRGVEDGGRSIPVSDGIPLAVKAATSLDHLTPILGLTTKEVATLGAVLEEADLVSARPQHGDLWWRNIILWQGDYWVIDLEDFGRSWVPLYDALTLVASTLTLRGGEPESGLQRLCGPTDEATACRALLTSRANAAGVDPEKVDGLLTYYALRTARRTYQRAGPEHAAPHLRAIRYVTDRLTDGQRGLLSP